MYVIDFTVNNDLKEKRRLFGLLQELLRKGFNPRSPEETVIFGDVRKKIRVLSDENGDICLWCGHVARLPEGATVNRLLKMQGGLLSLENEEHRLVTETLKVAPKQNMFDAVEEINDLIRLFTDAKKQDPPAGSGG